PDHRGKRGVSADSRLRPGGSRRRSPALDGADAAGMVRPRRTDRGRAEDDRTVQPFERECFRKDGSRVPVLIGSVTLEESETEGVAFVLDLTERKRAEAEARASERRFREVQMELAHANRVATMGQLTASIAHEVSQPIAA